MKKINYRLIQIPEIKSELNRKNINVLKIIKLFKELFEDLYVETTALSCVEIDQLCAHLVATDKIGKLPEIAQDLIEDCMTLHDFPSEYALITPLELLNEFNKIYNYMHDNDESTFTMKDRILNLYEKGKNIDEISKDLNINKKILERQITIARKLNQI